MGSVIGLKEPQQDCLTFARQDGELPARIVTAISGEVLAARFLFECSLGIIHEKRPPKRFHWATVSARLNSSVYLTEYSEIYGRPNGPLRLICRLYSENNDEVPETVLEYDSVDDLPNALRLDEIFENNDSFLGDRFGYVSLFCAWGGLFLLSTMETDNAFTMEHSF